jgi:hypothetical protein
MLLPRRLKPLLPILKRPRLIALKKRRQMRLTQRKRTAEQELTFARHRRDDAVKAAIKADPAVQRLIATFTDAHRRYIDLKRTLDCVARANRRGVMRGSTSKIKDRR